MLRVQRTAAMVRRFVETALSLDLSGLTSLLLPVVDLPAESTIDGVQIASTADLGGGPRIYSLCIPVVPGGAPYPRLRFLEAGTVTAVRVNIDGAATTTGYYTLGVYNYPGWKNLLSVSSIDLTNAGAYAGFDMASLPLTGTAANLVVAAGDTLQVQTESSNVDLAGANVVTIQVEVEPS